MITGVDYVLFSNQNPFDIENLFISFLKRIWATPVIDEFERTDSHLELFFAKDKEMYSLFDDVGYTLNEKNEGCFMLIANLFPQLDTTVKILNTVTPEERSNIDPYDSIVIFSNVWEYTLVLPSETEDADFSQNIYNYLHSALRNPRDNSHQLSKGV